jgi:DNA-binding NarL/FixJ family response regulator
VRHETLQLLIDADVSFRRQPAVTETKPGASAKRILIAEDNRADARTIERLLRESGYPAEIEHARTLDETLSQCSLDCADIVLLDLGLPGCTGTEALEAVRLVCPRIAVVIVTGTDDDDVMVKAAGLGASGYIRKERLNVARLLFAIYSALRAQDDAERQRDLAVYGERIRGYVRKMDEELERLEQLLERDNAKHP